MSERPAWLGDFADPDPKDVVREPLVIVPLADADAAFEVVEAVPAGTGPRHAEPEPSEGTHDEPDRGRPAHPPAAVPPAQPTAGSATGHPAGLGTVTVVYRRSVPPAPAPTRRTDALTRRPAVGLAALLLLGLAAAFFAWVTAEPFWLAVRHAEPGTATVTRCVDGRCVGTFTAAGFTRTDIPVMGDVPAPGVPVAARMTSARGTRAYIDTDAGSRAVAGVALLLLCGAGIAWATGARRLPAPRARLIAIGACLAGPLVLFVGMLAVTF